MPSVRLLLCLLSSLVLILSALPLYTAVVSTRITSNLLLLYTFQEGQFNVNTSSTLDLSRQNLLPALNLPTFSSAWSTQRQGLTLTGQYDNATTPSPSIIKSSAIVSYFKLNIQSSFSVEAFFSPASLTQRGVLAGFGGWDPSTVDSGCQGGTTGWRDWYLYQNGSYITTVLSHGGSTPGCSSVSIPISSSAAVHHVVTSVAVVGSTANVSCYYNGQWVLSKLITQTSFQQWQASNYLQLASARLSAPASPAATWKGSLYLFAMYSPALSASDVATNYQSYLPNSAPVLASLNQSATVVQNSTSTLLTTVTFTATDYDGDTILYRIVSMPDKGQLVLFDPPSNTTTPLSAGIVFYLSSTDELFQYTPVVGEWGASYVQFSFAACDLSVCGVAAVVTVDVLHIVTPPVPTSAAVSLLSGASVVVQLSGVDVDAQVPVHANMTSATLLSLPVNGLLYLWNGTAASPSTPLNASSLLTLTAAASPQCPLCLLYVPTTPLSATNGSNYNDTVTFVVAVKNTSSTTNATVTLTVTNPLTAQAVTVSLLGDAPLYFGLRGSSALRTAFSYLVLSLPQKGTLTLQNGQAVSVWTAGSSSGVVNGSVALWSTSQVAFTSAVSVYAGRYNSSLDPISDTFTYSLLDAAGNHAAATTVTIVYPLIHHAPSVPAAFTSDLAVNVTSPSQDASMWTVIPYTIVDADATATSAFAAANPTFPYNYNVVVSVAPLTGAVLRLDPQRTVIVTVVSGLATGSVQLSFTCGLAACNAVLAGLQLQANVAKLYNLSIAVTQVDTAIVTRSSTTVTAQSDTSATSTGTTANQPPSSSSNNDSLSALFAPTSKYFWILIACCVGVLVLLCLGWKYRRTVRAQQARKKEITSVAVELAKAVGSDKKEATEAIEARAEKRALDTIASFQALSSPRMQQLGVDPASFAATQGLPYLQSPMAGMGVGMAMSPRGGIAGGGGMFGVMPMTPSSQQQQQQMGMCASPRSVHLDFSSMADEVTVQQQQQWLAQQQMAQFGGYPQQMMIPSPRLSPAAAAAGHPFSPSFITPSPRATPFSASQPLAAMPSPRQAATTAPLVPSRRFSFAMGQQRGSAREQEEQVPAVRPPPRLSLMVTPAEEDEPPIMPQLREFVV